MCKGLVVDRIHDIRHDRPVIPIRSSNSSYGILYKELYTENHAGRQSVTLDGKKYVENQIDWLVVKGSNYQRRDMVRRAYSILADPELKEQGWCFGLVRSTSDVRPEFFDARGDVEVVGHVVSIPEARLHEQGAAQRRRLFSRKTVFSRLDCRLSIEIGLGTFEFNSTIVGPRDERSQTLTIQRSDHEGRSDLIRM